MSAAAGVSSASKPVWGFKSLYIHLNKTGERIQERDEPPPELPTLLTKAIEAVQPDVTLEGIASTVGLLVADLRGLTGALVGPA